MLAGGFEEADFALVLAAAELRVGCAGSGAVRVEDFGTATVLVVTCPAVFAPLVFTPVEDWLFEERAEGDLSCSF